MRRRSTVSSFPSARQIMPVLISIIRSCTQCLNVGFECKTSDKLSRRAFPRGYTESLEERVRALESEVRELRDLLDEKEEKLEMLSRVRGHSSPTTQSISSPKTAVS